MLKKKRAYLAFCLGWFAFALLYPSSAGEIGTITHSRDLDVRIQDWMDEGDIPGLCLIIVKGDNETIAKGYGYADLKNKISVTPRTLFELASCSKAFTALAILQLVDRGMIDLQDPVSKFFPWFFVKYKGQRYSVTLRHLLHHTSGLPANTIFRIPVGGGPRILEQTVKNMAGMELNHIPGRSFEYATVNYSIAGAIVEKVTGTAFERYMTDHIFLPLGLGCSFTSVVSGNHLKATGYKIGFWAPREYNPPAFRGNNPAAYIVSNGNDMARWLKLQMGILSCSLDSIIQKSHVPARNIPIDPETLSSYSMGWRVSQKGDGIIYHSGLNPNFTAFVAFRPDEKTGIAVLANSNSGFTQLIGRYVLKQISGDEAVDIAGLPGTLDKPCSMISIILGLFLVLAISYLILIVVGIFRGRRKFEVLNFKKVFRAVIAVLIGLPFMLGVYLIPGVLMGASWNSAVVWAPISFPAAALLILASFGAGYLAFFVSSLFPSKSKLKNEIPLIIVLSTLAGVANSGLLLLIFSSFSNGMAFHYLLFFFALGLLLSISATKVAQTKLIKITNEVVYDFRMKLIHKIFSTIFQKFERLDVGRIYATLNNDTERLAQSPALVVNLISQVSVVLFVFVYLASVSLLPTIFILLFILFIGMIYSVVSRGTNHLFEEVRDTQNVFMKLIDGVVKGFKELSMHRMIKKEYKQEMKTTCNEYRRKKILVLIKFLHLRIFASLILIILLGIISIGFKALFPAIPIYTLLAFVVALIYIIAPLGIIFESIPNIIQIKVSWKRIQQFIKDIPSAQLEDVGSVPEVKDEIVENIQVEGLMFAYESKDDAGGFNLGPIDFELQKGEILFIIGGNGSGKTTLAKLLTGLYVPDSGKIRINGNDVGLEALSEYFSAVFSDFHLFEKLYNIDLNDKDAVISEYLERLNLQSKVKIVNNAFSTIDLSGGQKKRLALFKVYLENHPVYLFDEIAAGQDPDFRRFFYRNLLLKMKEEKKIVIVITHDDHYFDVADKIIKLDMGRVDLLENIDKYKFIGREKLIYN